MTDIRDIIGDDIEPGELERLERVHALLEQAGAPPELTAVAAAAVAACALFGIGYLVGGGSSQDPIRTVAMSGPSQASAELALFGKDTAGNWPMRLDVRGLASGRYELWLTRGGKLVEPCGAFAAGAGETSVPLNAPYRLRDFDGWVVVSAGDREPVLTTA